MITKDQIKEAAIARGFKLSNEAGDDLKPYVYGFARDLIKLAQEVRPLVFEPSIYNVLFCRTAFGLYEVHPENEGWLFYLDGYSDCGYLQTEAEAIAAAQADFNRRVLENLTHGVADEN